MTDGARTRPDCDVAIVGAGPAGGMAALELARAGARVVVIEKQTLPRYKTCGGGVVGRALALLPDEVRRVSELDCRAVELAYEERAFRVERDEIVVAMTMRADLDGALIDAAVRAGAELRAPCAFRRIDTMGAALVVTTDAGELSASVVIAGDGALSPVAKAAGFPDAPPPIPALEAELRVADAVRRRFDAPRFDFGTIARGYAWVFPKGAHLSVGVLSTRRGRVALQDELARYLAHVGIEPLFVERHGFVIPVAPRRTLARAGVLLVGDAAGLADPVTCEGISWALESGRLAARAFLEHGPSPDAVVRAYVRALRTRVLPELTTARLLADVLYSRPRAARFVFRRHGRALCEAMTDVVLGKTTYRALVRDPRSWLRLLRAAPRLQPGPAGRREAPSGAQSNGRT